MWLLSFIQVLSDIMDAGINKLTYAVSFAYWSIISSTNSFIYSTIQKWLFSISKIKKIQEPGFTSKPSEKPYFSCIFDYFPSSTNILLQHGSVLQRITFSKPTVHGNGITPISSLKRVCWTALKPWYCHIHRIWQYTESLIFLVHLYIIQPVY